MITYIPRDSTYPSSPSSLHLLPPSLPPSSPSTDSFFLSTVLTSSERHTLLLLYSRSFDVVALIAIALVCFISIIYGLVMVVFWAVLAGVKATQVVIANAFHTCFYCPIVCRAR